MTPVARVIPGGIRIVSPVDDTGGTVFVRQVPIRLTMNTYTHLQLIDTGSAVETLPSLGMTRRDTNRQLPTGTNG
jgi:hypothetical protein